MFIIWGARGVSIRGFPCAPPEKTHRATDALVVGLCLLTLRQRLGRQRRRGRLTGHPALPCGAGGAGGGASGSAVGGFLAGQQVLWGSQVVGGWQPELRPSWINILHTYSYIHIYMYVYIYTYHTCVYIYINYKYIFRINGDLDGLANRRVIHHLLSRMILQGRSHFCAPLTCQ